MRSACSGGRRAKAFVQLALISALWLAGCGGGSMSPDLGLDQSHSGDLAPSSHDDAALSTLDAAVSDAGDASPRSLASLRDHLFSTLLQPGEAPCERWSSYDPSARAIFLTITDRLWLSQTPDGLSMLDHIVRVYGVLGGGAKGTTCGGVDNNRMFLGMDDYLWGLLNDAWNGGQVITDGGGHYWGKSADLGGPHKPFNLSDETATGTQCNLFIIETGDSKPPTGQVQFFKDGTATAFQRGGLSFPADPRMLEFDHDYNCLHDSNPTCQDFTQRYVKNYGDFACDWVPVACRPAASGCYPAATP